MTARGAFTLDETTGDASVSTDPHGDFGRKPAQESRGGVGCTVAPSRCLLCGHGTRAKAVFCTGDTGVPCTGCTLYWGHSALGVHCSVVAQPENGPSETCPMSSFHTGWLLLSDIY